MSLSCGCLHRISNIGKPPDFIPGTPALKTVPETSLPVGTREWWLHAHPGWHSVETAKATPAPWAQEQNRLPKQDCSYSRESAETVLT